MTDELVDLISGEVRRLANERDRDPYTVAIQLLILMNPEAVKEWADRGFPRSE